MTVMAKHRALYSPEDEEWRRYLRYREPGMVNVLVERYRPFAMRLVRDYLCKRPDCRPYCDDLLSAALVGLWRAVERFDPEAHEGANFHGWAVLCIQTRICDVVRPGRVVGNQLERDGKVEPMPDPVAAGPAEDHSGGLDGRILLDEVMARLAPAQRMAIMLRYVDGLSVEEIAQRLGATPPGAEALIETALSLLRG